MYEPEEFYDDNADLPDHKFIGPSQGISDAVAESDIFTDGKNTLSRATRNLGTISSEEADEAYAELKRQNKHQKVNWKYPDKSCPGLVYVLNEERGRTHVGTFKRIGCDLSHPSKDSLHYLLTMGGHWNCMPECLHIEGQNWNDHLGCGIVIVPLSKASKEEKDLFHKCKNEGHGIRAGQEESLVQRLEKLKQALDARNPRVGSYRYLVFSLKDENGRERATPVLINVFTRAEEIRALPENGGLGMWHEKSVVYTPNGVGLNGRVKVVKIESRKVNEYLRGRGYDGQTVTDSEEWDRVMREHSAAQESERATYYVWDQDGKLLNGGQPFESIRKFRIGLNGQDQRGKKDLQKEINANGLKATGGSMKWVNKDRARDGKAVWDNPCDGKTYTIRGR